jgi:hypothetical protein
MFTLRFFAGPIVHKINPVGLLFVSSLLGVLGLWLLGQPFTNTIPLWVGAVTIYGIGKTFYWPTLLGVISERFPKGGALALGISGGVGMLAAGLLGGPGIGYKQDFFAAEKLQGTPTFQRYVARDEHGQPVMKPFPLLTSLFPKEVPEIAGLDNQKLKTLNEYVAVKAGTAKQTTLEADFETMQNEKKAGKPVQAMVEKNLTMMMEWWEKEGLPNYQTDKELLDPATLYGAKTALLYTAAVPAALAVGFLLLIIVFAAMGGYKQVHLEGGAQGH